MRCAGVLVCAAVAWVFPGVLHAQQAASDPDPRDPAVAQAGEADGNPKVSIKQLERQLLILKKQRTALLDKLAAEYRARPESLQIVQERDDARRALKTASDRPLAVLRQGIEYRGLLARKQDLQAKSESLQASASASSERKIEAAAVFRQAELLLAQMERDAVACDLDLIAAKARLARAEAAVARLEDEASAYAISSKQYEQLVQAAIQARDGINVAQSELRVAELADGIPDYRSDLQKATDDEERRTFLMLCRRFNPRTPTEFTVTPGKLKTGLPVGSVVPDGYVSQRRQPRR